MIGKRDLPSSLFSFANDNYTLTFRREAQKQEEVMYERQNPYRGSAISHAAGLTQAVREERTKIFKKFIEKCLTDVPCLCYNTKAV